MPPHAREFAPGPTRPATQGDDGDSDPDPALVSAVADAVVARLMKLLPANLFESQVEAPSPTGEWLTAAQAARYLGMNRKALYSAVQRRQVLASRLGRRLRFNRVGLDHLLARRQSRGVQPSSRVPSLGKGV